MIMSIMTLSKKIYCLPYSNYNHVNRPHVHDFFFFFFFAELAQFNASSRQLFAFKVKLEVYDVLMSIIVSVGTKKPILYLSYNM